MAMVSTFSHLLQSYFGAGVVMFVEFDRLEWLPMTEAFDTEGAGHCWA